MDPPNAFEEARARRVEENLARLRQLGVPVLPASTQPPAKRKRERALHEAAPRSRAPRAATQGAAYREAPLPPGGRVSAGRGERGQLDPVNGVTCHYCRQKANGAHALCCCARCAAGGRNPVAFCAPCLRNRNGEDAARLPAGWEAPPCRKACLSTPPCAGPCCNCSRCMHLSGRPPTGALVAAARAAGYGDVHALLCARAAGM